MSEKRQRKQQRRKRRKAKSAGRPRAKAVSTDELVAELATYAVEEAGTITDGFEAEQWASALATTWARPGEPFDEELYTAFLAAVETLASPAALAVLRAFDATEAADRLAATGQPEPAWRDELGQARPVQATILRERPFDDRMTVLLEFADPPHLFSVHLDNNLGGLVDEVELLDVGEAALDAEPLALDEARAHVEWGYLVLDQLQEPVVGEYVYAWRALLEKRLAMLPDGFAFPAPREYDQAERDALLSDFLASPDGERWRGDQDAEYAAQLAIDFGADLNHDGPLRWSPAVVEVFMLDWLGGKVIEAPDFFVRLPAVLASWVSYAGRRRGVPEASITTAVAAVNEHRNELLDTIDDPSTWGPAKRFATEAAEAGIELTDTEAVQRLIDEINQRGGL